MTELVIASHLPGRLRLRGGPLRFAPRNQALCAQLRGWPGVLAVDGNATSGSILVRYDIAIVDFDTMAGRFGRQHPDPVHPAEPASRRLNRAAKPLMLATMAASMAALATSRKLHAAFGVAYLAVLATHLIHHRQSILR